MTLTPMQNGDVPDLAHAALLRPKRAVSRIATTARFRWRREATAAKAFLCREASRALCSSSRKKAKEGLVRCNYSPLLVVIRTNYDSCCATAQHVSHESTVYRCSYRVMEGEGKELL